MQVVFVVKELHVMSVMDVLFVRMSCVPSCCLVYKLMTGLGLASYTYVHLGYLPFKRLILIFPSLRMRAFVFDGSHMSIYTCTLAYIQVYIYIHRLACSWYNSAHDGGDSSAVRDQLSSSYQ